jgi:flagellar basal body rod protein FlgB
MRRFVAASLLTLSFSAYSFDIVAYNVMSFMYQGIRFVYSDSIPKELIVTSIGTGKTREEAIDKALLSGIQESLGVLIVSDETAENDRIVRNLVAQYSSGIVNKYEVKSCVGSNPITCTVTARVSPWNFQRKLMGDSNTIKVNGDDLQAQHMTAKHVLIQRQKLTKYYLSQIQQSGLEVKIKEVKVLPSMAENAKVVIEYEVRWIPEFKKSIISFLEKLEKDTDGKTKNNNQVYIQWNATSFAENRVRINTYDDGFRTMMENYLRQPVSIRIDELGTCEQFDATGGVFGIDWYGFRKQKTVSMTPEQLSRIDKISMSVGCKL